jgi:hypothetical protein
MRAFLTATSAVVALGLLAACGNPDDQAPAASDQGRQSSQTGQTATAPTKPAPEPPSTAVEPTPPASGKPQDPSGGQAPVTIGPNGPVVPPGVTEVPASQVDASALPNYVEYGNRVWAFNGGFSLQFFASASTACAGLEARVVDQASDTVKILVQPMDMPQGGRPDDQPCAMVMTPQVVTVTLDTPLQDRTVVLSAGR